MKNIKKLLSQYTSLTEEIKELEKEINRLERQEPKIAFDTVKGSSKYFPYTERTFTIIGIEENKNLEKKKEILLKRKRICEKLKLQIEEFISSIPDSLTRRVFRFRYIEGLSWPQIARRIGKYDESYPRKMIHNKYLESLDEKEE